MESKLFQTLEGFSQLTNCVEKRTKRKGAETAKDREGGRGEIFSRPESLGVSDKKAQKSQKGK